jgi:N-acetylmuramoyl-L-alanine amidase
MKHILGFAVLGAVIALPVQANETLKIVYPPDNHETTAAQIFFIGTAPPQGEVTVNGQAIANRSPAGHFAPTFPLQLGENTFVFRYQNQTLTKKATRIPTGVSLPTGVSFAKDSLTPATNVARQPGEPICFSAVAPPNAQVAVILARQTIPLAPQTQEVALPPNSAVLTQTTQPTASQRPGLYQGCMTATQPGNLGKPRFQLRKDGKTIHQEGAGTIEILAANDHQGSGASARIQATQFAVAEVTVDQGVARTGPSTDHSRLTPLPKGTRAGVTGREGDWLRLDYGGWINQKETQGFNSPTPAQTIIRGLRSRQVPGWTEVIFPLQTPVPVTVDQRQRTFTLTLHNTTAQTDTIYLDNDPVISRLDWQQVSPTQARYTFNLKPAQQWGYKLRYEGTSLVLSLRHPPETPRPDRVGQRSRPPAPGTLTYGNTIRTGTVVPPLAGMKILLDPGHGSENDLGARGPTGYPEKDVALVISKLVREQLIKRGATVVMTREGDQDLYPQDRVDVINKTEPNLVLSLHYNALPDEGDALNTRGIGAFWYHTQGHSLATFLHDYLVQKLGQPSYGVFWNNLALTRPTVAPAVLMELGFMINPLEFEWITNPQEQQKLAAAMADGVVEWTRLQQLESRGLNLPRQGLSE